MLLFLMKQVKIALYYAAEAIENLQPSIVNIT